MARRSPARWRSASRSASGGQRAANDSWAELATSGQVFVNNDDVAMLVEDLFVSAAEIRVRYRFHKSGRSRRGGACRLLDAGHHRRQLPQVLSVVWTVRPGSRCARPTSPRSAT
ncbi:DUF4424 family protein [Rhodoplanes serenus]|uniref:DUF4424 family protein n=1 Tax=Rhodoplanes serenus TaxID=200615 RepID=UPI00131B98D1